MQSGISRCGIQLPQRCEQDCAHEFAIKVCLSLSEELCQSARFPDRVAIAPRQVQNLPIKRTPNYLKKGAKIHR